MSAYQCTRCHVSALAGALASAEEPDGWNEKRVRELYTELSRANALSVVYRYPDRPEPAFEPEPCWNCATHHFAPLAIYKAVQCYWHQACEPHGWDESSLARRLELLKNDKLANHFAQSAEYHSHLWGLRPEHPRGVV